MSFFDKIRDWFNREPVDLDAEDRAAAELGRRVSDAMMRQVDSAAHANRSTCGERADASPGVFYTCTLPSDHKGQDHECRISGPSSRLLATWAVTGGAVTETPIYDEVQRMQAAKRIASGAMDARARTDAAEMEAEMLAVLDIGRTANALRDADTIAVDYALAGLIDDNPDLAALLHEGGEDR